MRFLFRHAHATYQVSSLALAFLVAGCRGRAGAADRGIDAAVVPNADVIVRLDLKTLRDSPIGKKFQELKDQREKDNPALAADAERRDRIEKASGITQQDVNSLLITANLGNVDFKSAGESMLAGNLQGVLAVGLAKAVSMDQLREAARIMTADRANGTVQDVNLNGARAVMISPTASGQPPAYAAMAPDGKTIYITINESSMAGVLTRQRETRREQPSPALLEAERSMPPGTQARAVFIAPDALRQAIKDKLATADRNPTATMLMGLIKPLEGLRSVALYAECAQQAQVGLDVTVDSAENATRLAMLLPVLMAFAPAGATGVTPDLMKGLTVTNTGSVVSLRLTVKEQDLDASSAPAHP